MQPNKKVGIYSFNNQNILGSGSYSTVYIGKNDDTQQIVAIKVITRQSLTDTYMFDTLVSEIEILKHLDHPNIVRLYDVLSTANNIYIITEYCNGGTLDELLKREKRLPENQAIEVMKDLLHGFREILGHSIVHRDIKPANIFIHEGRYKIGDFGFAKKVDDLDEKLMKSIVGTPLYMSPECLENRNYSSKNDVYSLGVIFYKLLYGRTPWPSKTRVELMKNMYSSPLIIPNEDSISMVSKQFLQKALQYRELERINWQEIYDYPIFKEKEVIPIKNDDIKIEEEPISNEITDNMISVHIRIIKRIYKLIKLLQENQSITAINAIKLAMILMKDCQYHTSDLSNRIKIMKGSSSPHHSELLNQIELEVQELENKNSDELKVLNRLLRNQESLNSQSTVEIHKTNINEELTSTRSMFIEILDCMRPVIRECNHKIFEERMRNGRKTTEIDGEKILMELLYELMGIYKMVEKLGQVAGETNFEMIIQKIDGGIEKLIEVNQEQHDYQALRKLIYDYSI